MACPRGKSRGSSSRSWRPTSPGGSLRSSPSLEPPLRSGPLTRTLLPVSVTELSVGNACVFSAVCAGGGAAAGPGAGLHVPPERSSPGAAQLGLVQLLLAAEPWPPAVAAYRQEVQPARFGAHALWLSLGMFPQTLTHARTCVCPRCP